MTTMMVKSVVNDGLSAHPMCMEHSDRRIPISGRKLKRYVKEELAHFLTLREIAEVSFARHLG